MSNLRRCRLWPAIFPLCWIGCGSLMTDADIKQTLVGGSKAETAFAAVNYSIRDGVVTLTGNCPSEQERTKVAERVRHTSGVERVVNRLAIAPVVLDGDFPLKQAVDSILAGYPMVVANVQDSMVVVSGTTKPDELQRLAKALGALNARGVQLNVAGEG